MLPLGEWSVIFSVFDDVKLGTIFIAPWPDLGSLVAPGTAMAVRGVVTVGAESRAHGFATVPGCQSSVRSGADVGLGPAKRKLRSGLPKVVGQPSLLSLVLLVVLLDTRIPLFVFSILLFSSVLGNKLRPSLLLLAVTGSRPQLLTGFMQIGDAWLAPREPPF